MAAAAARSMTNVAAAVREPTEAQVMGFHSIIDVFNWSRIVGGLDCPGSRAGSLLRLLAHDDWFEAGIDDIAGISTDDFERILVDWRYCNEAAGAAAEGADFIDNHLELMTHSRALYYWDLHVHFIRLARFNAG